MKIHLVPQFGEIIISTGLETEVSRSWFSYRLNVITVRPVAVKSIRTRRWLFGLIELDKFENDFESGTVLTLSMTAPLFLVVGKAFKLFR